MNETKSEKPETNVASMRVVVPAPTVQMQMAMRANLAAYHLQAAVSFARSAHDIETRNHGRPFDNAFTPIFWHTSSSVIMSATTLEARINELIKDVLDDKSLSPESVADYERLMGRAVARRPGESELVAKYKKFAALRGAPIDEASPLYISLVTLIRFRNSLVHFKPEWDYEDGPQKALFKMLDGKFDVMRNLVFPMSHLTYGGAKWAVGIAREFSADYAKLIGVTDHLVTPWLDLDLP